MSASKLVRCYLCQREVQRAGTYLDKDGDYWCITGDKWCKTIARLALTDPDRLMAERLARRYPRPNRPEGEGEA